MMDPKKGNDQFLESSPQSQSEGKKSQMASFQIEKAFTSASQSTIQLSKGTSVFESVLTMFAATIGTVALMISNSMAASGVAWSVVQMIICAIVTYFSLITLVKCADYIHVFSYQDLALNVYGHWCRQLVNIFSFCANWGSMILYLKLIVELYAVIVGVFFGSRVPGWLINPESKILIVVIATVFVLPLAIAKGIRGLRHLCLINFLIMIFFCIVIFTQENINQSFYDSIHNIAMWNLAGWTTTFPSAVFAYMSHASVLDVYKELDQSSLLKMRRVIRLTIITVFVGYVCIGLTGYLTFSQNLTVLSDPDKSNGILLIAYGYNLDGTRGKFPSIVVICMIMMAVSIVLSQPFNLSPAKSSLRNFLRPLSNASRDKSVESTWERIIYSMIALYSGVAVAIIFQSAQGILNILGSTFYPFLNFILPSMFFLKIFNHASIPVKILHWAMIIGSLVFTVLNTIDNIQEIIEEANAPHSSH